MRTTTAQKNHISGSVFTFVCGSLGFWFFVLNFMNRWFSADVTAAMLVYRTIEKKVFWEFDSIIMQNMSYNLLLFCTPTWPTSHVIENHL